MFVGFMGFLLFFGFLLVVHFCVPSVFVGLWFVVLGERFYEGVISILSSVVGVVGPIV